METKYEKIDPNNMRKWQKDTSVLNKQDLTGERSEWDFITNMSDVILDRIGSKYGLDSTVIKADAQTKVDELDALLDYINNPNVTPEEIDFIDEP